MVLPNTIIVVFCFYLQAEMQRWLLRLLRNLTLYCLVLVEGHRKRAFFPPQEDFFFSVSLCRSCLKALNTFLFFFPAQILEPK